MVQQARDRLQGANGELQAVFTALNAAPIAALLMFDVAILSTPTLVVQLATT